MTPLSTRTRPVLLSFGLLVAGCHVAACHVASDDPSHATASTSATKATSPLLGIGAPAEGEREIDGVVRELLPAGPYRYVEVVDAAGQSAWIATLSTSATVGDTVHVQSFGARTDFHSKRLGRTFERLLFGMVKPVERAG